MFMQLLTYDEEYQTLQFTTTRPSYTAVLPSNTARPPSTTI